MRKNLEEFELYKKTQEEIFDSMYDGVYITDEKGVTLYVNKSYTRISGLEKSQVVGKHMEELLAEGHFVDSASLKVLKEKREITMTDTFKNKNQCLITSSPVYDEKGNIKRVVTNLRDMTELNRLSKKLEEARSLNKKYKKELETLSKDGIKTSIKAKSKVMKSLIELVDIIAKTDSTILVYGETGVGKEVIAKEIYRKSLRGEKPFVRVNCASVPESLVESEFFGYEKGAFTGALNKGKKGFFEMADKGTILLDEIGDLPLSMQPKLLRVLQEGEFTPVGSEKLKKVDVRVIAATNLDLKKRVEEGLFREDLYYRLSVIPIEVPPLRKRTEDIPFLALYFLEAFNQKYKSKKHFSNEVLELMGNYSWPGNVRELINFVERSWLTTMEDEIGAGNISFNKEVEDKNKDGMWQEETLAKNLEKVECEIIKSGWERTGSTRDLAKLLGISQTSVVRKMKKYSIT